jgi:spore coat protein H
LHRPDLRKATLRRFLEKASLYLGVILGLGALSAGIWLGVKPGVDTQESLQVTAQATGMPIQGWAPLTVYFSAYGSHANLSAISRYEWDLDGNGQFDFDATADGGYASYLYSKPGEYTITLRVTDTQGRTATDLVRVTVRHPASSSVDYWTVFDPARVRRIDLSLSQADWDRMWADSEAKVMVTAEAVIFGERLSQVGLRMRGQFSLRVSGDKKPWAIDTDAYIDGQEFHNLRKLLLINNIGDPSLLKEALAYQMMAFAGVPASHTAFVQLWFDILDDESPAIFWGVYTLVERVDNKYLANRFGADSTSGNLYKASHAQRGPMDLIYYGDRIADYPQQNGQYAYGKQNNEAEADYSDIVNLCRVIDGTHYPSEQDFIQALESTFDVDAFLRYMAVVTILDNWDTYPNTGNNYFLFNDPVGGRFEWIPWDLTWGENAQAPLFMRSGEGLLSRAPLSDQVFQIASYRSRYLAYADLLLRSWFTPQAMTDRVQNYHEMITPYINQSTGDKAFFGDHAMFPGEAFTNSPSALLQFVTQRGEFLRNALAAETTHGLP